MWLLSIQFETRIKYWYILVYVEQHFFYCFPVKGTIAAEETACVECNAKVNRRRNGSEQHDRSPDQWTENDQCTNCVCPAREDTGRRPGILFGPVVSSPYRSWIRNGQTVREQRGTGSPEKEARKLGSINTRTLQNIIKIEFSPSNYWYQTIVTKDLPGNRFQLHYQHIKYQWLTRLLKCIWWKKLHV